MESNREIGIEFVNKHLRVVYKTFPDSNLIRLTEYKLDECKSLQ